MKSIIEMVTTASAALLLVAINVSFNACSQHAPVASRQDVRTVDNGLTILRFHDSAQRLNKTRTERKLVHKEVGAELVLEHGTKTSYTIYGNENGAPYDVYTIDPSDPDNSPVVGQLAFASSALALHPSSGLIYYVGKYDEDDVFPVATWDPETNINTLLPQGSAFKPAYKLAFDPDGILYGIKDDNSSSDELYTIDTVTGAWTFLRDYDAALDDDGDLAFGPDGKLYNVNEDDEELQVLDLHSDDVTTVADLEHGDVSGLAFTPDGQLYFCSDGSSKLYSLDLSSGEVSFLGETNLGEIDDFAPVIALTELSYAKASLQVLPGAIDGDTEFELSIDTNEIVGRVSITFGPHGTVFNLPVILNMEVQGIDFSGVDPDAVNIYYDNQEDGGWELMGSDAVIINADAGTCRVINARLPHFSRYAIGME
jgi:WD40 repeat protein